MKIKLPRKLVSARVSTEEFAALRKYAADRGETQDAVVSRWLRPFFEMILPKPHEPGTE